MFAGETSYDGMMERAREHLGMLELYYEARTMGVRKLLQEGFFDFTNPDHIRNFGHFVASAHAMWVRAKTYLDVVLAHPQLRPEDNNLIRNAFLTLEEDLLEAGLEVPRLEGEEEEEDYQDTE